MSLTITTTATNTLMTQLETVKDMLEVKDGKHDQKLSAMIQRASDTIKAHCDRHFAIQTYTETLSGDGSNFLVLRHSPIVSVTSVALRGDTATDYSVDDADDGVLFRENGWEWTIGLSRSLGVSPQPGNELNKWTVVYRAGFIMPGDTDTSTAAQQMPGDLEQATLETVKYWFKNRKNQDILSKKVGALAIQYAPNSPTGAGLPARVEGLLRKWEWLEGF
jgi:hypothetical protein